MGVRRVQSIRFLTQATRLHCFQHGELSCLGSDENTYPSGCKSCAVVVVVVVVSGTNKSKGPTIRPPLGSNGLVLELLQGAVVETKLIRACLHFHMLIQLERIMAINMSKRGKCRKRKMSSNQSSAEE